MDYSASDSKDRKPLRKTDCKLHSCFDALFSGWYLLESGLQSSNITVFYMEGRNPSLNNETDYCQHGFIAGRSTTNNLAG